MKFFANSQILFSWAEPESSAIEACTEKQPKGIDGGEVRRLSEDKEGAEHGEWDDNIIEGCEHTGRDVGRTFIPEKESGAGGDHSEVEEGLPLCCGNFECGPVAKEPAGKQGKEQATGIE